jgi:hypothetical protein
VLLLSGLAVLTGVLRQCSDQRDRAGVAERDPAGGAGPGTSWICGMPDGIGMIGDVRGSGPPAVRRASLVPAGLEGGAETTMQQGVDIGER